MDPNTSNVLRDIQEQLQLMRADMNNISERLKSIKTLQTKQSNENEIYNDNHRNRQRLVPRKNHQHDHHQGHNEFDDPNNIKYFNNYC
jgi:septation ring formation regulator EzrA